MLNSKIRVRAYSDLKFRFQGDVEGIGSKTKNVFFKGKSKVLSSKIKFLIYLDLLFVHEGVRRGRVKNKNSIFHGFRAQK